MVLVKFAWNITVSTTEGLATQIARSMRPKWGLPGAGRTQVGPILAPWTLLLGQLLVPRCPWWTSVRGPWGLGRPCWCRGRGRHRSCFPGNQQCTACCRRYRHEGHSQNTPETAEKQDIDVLVQERRNSIANVLELRPSWTNPSMWYMKTLVPETGI